MTYVSVIHFPLYFVKYNHKINPEYHPSPNPIPQTNNLFFFWVKSSQVSGLCISPVELSESLYWILVLVVSTIPYCALITYSKKSMKCSYYVFDIEIYHTIPIIKSSTKIWSLNIRRYLRENSVTRITGSITVKFNLYSSFLFFWNT